MRGFLSWNSSEIQIQLNTIYFGKIYRNKIYHEKYSKIKDLNKNLRNRLVVQSVNIYALLLKFDNAISLRPKKQIIERFLFRVPPRVLRPRILLQVNKKSDWCWRPIGSPIPERLADNFSEYLLPVDKADWPYIFFQYLFQ